MSLDTLHRNYFTGVQDSQIVLPTMELFVSPPSLLTNITNTTSLTSAATNQEGNGLKHTSTASPFPWNIPLFNLSLSSTSSTESLHEILINTTLGQTLSIPNILKRTLSFLTMEEVSTTYTQLSKEFKKIFSPSNLSVLEYCQESLKESYSCFDGQLVVKEEKTLDILTYVIVNGAKLARAQAKR